MKRISFALLLGGLLLAMGSCKNDDDDGDGVIVGGDGDCTMSWTVDGDNYTVDMGLCIYFDSTLNLSVSATGGFTQLQVDPITSTGSYTQDLGTQNVIVLLELNDGTVLSMVTGSVEVSTLNNSRAKGTFSGMFADVMDANLTPDFTVTNGQFDADY